MDELFYSWSKRPMGVVESLWNLNNGVKSHDLQQFCLQMKVVKTNHMG
jgi:hypothetical protein